MQPLDTHRPLIDHLRRFFGSRLSICRFEVADRFALPETFQIARFDPGEDEGFVAEVRVGPRRLKLHVYATLGLAEVAGPPRIELFVLAPFEYPPLADMLAAVALRHALGQQGGGRRLGAGHSVGLGGPWMLDSACTRGLVSLPYLYGPALEQGPLDRQGHQLRVFWLLPITPEEDGFKASSGLEALEELFATAGINTADPHRPSVI